MCVEIVKYPIIQVSNGPVSRTSSFGLDWVESLTRLLQANQFRDSVYRQKSKWLSDVRKNSIRKRFCRVLDNVQNRLSSLVTDKNFLVPHL